MSQQKQHLTIRGEAGAADLGALLCDGVMLAILLWNQLRYGMNMLFLILPLALVGLYLVLFGLVTETYVFAEEQLQILHPLRRKDTISYEAVFNYEAAERDHFMNLTQKNVVKIYYFSGNKKKAVICRPRDVAGFTQALRSNCPEFATEEETKLDVFFEKHPQD